MIRTPFRARVAPSSEDIDLSEADFEAETEANRTLLRRGVGAFLVSLLGLGVMAGVTMAAAQNSSRQASSSIVVDSAAPDNTKAEPQQTTLTPEEKAAQSSQADPVGNAYTNRSSTDSNTVQSELNDKVLAADAEKRDSQLNQAGKAAVVAANTAAMEGRDARLDSDIAKAKAKAAEYAKARAEAQKKLAEQKALIAKLKAKKAAGTATAAEIAQLAVLESLPEGTVDSISSGGGTLPLAPGTFRMGSGFGAVGSWARYHTGQDMVAARGTPIRAVATGVVAPDPPGAWAGTHVALIHANGGATMYAHMDRRTVWPGEVVKVGQIIGYVGSSGRSFGPHLHFEYYPPGTTPGDVYSASNPLVFLRQLGVKI